MTSRDFFQKVFQADSRLLMDYHATDAPAKVYVPSIAISEATFKHSLAKLEVAVLHAPDEICGIAQRVGYTGSKDTDVAIYRLKIRGVRFRSTITLPGFYVIDKGIFTDYELWSKDHRTT